MLVQSYSVRKIIAELSPSLSFNWTEMVFILILQHKASAKFSKIHIALAKNLIKPNHFQYRLSERLNDVHIDLAKSKKLLFQG